MIPGVTASGNGGIVLPSYTRVDPMLFWSGKVGHIDDELGLTDVVDTNLNAKILYDPAGGPDNEGGWEFVGGNQGGDCCLMSTESSYPVAANDVWCAMRFKWIAAPNSGRFAAVLCVPLGNDGVSMAGDKPGIKFSSTSQLYLGDSNSETNDVALYSPLSTNGIYTVVLHGRGGTTGDLTHEAWLYDVNGTLLDSVTSDWPVLTAGSNNVCKFGNSGGGDTTGANYKFAHCGIWKATTTNPGPCRGYVKFPSSTVVAGNFTAVGAATLHEACDDPAAGSRQVTDLVSTSASTAISSEEANFTADDVGAAIRNHSGVANTSRRIASVTDENDAVLDSSTGVSTSAGTAAIIHRRSNDADTTYCNVASATASNMELGLSADDVPSGDEVHTVICEVVQRHTGSAPSLQLGIKSGSTSELLTTFPATSTAYNRRRSATTANPTAPSHSLDPATSARWTPAAANAVTALVRDNDSLNREFRVTALRVLVVAAQISA